MKLAPLIEIADEKPDNAQEELIQLAFAVANLFDGVTKAISKRGPLHPLAAIEEIESPIIMNSRPDGKKRVRLVGVTMPLPLLEQIRNVSLQLCAQRLADDGKGGGDDG